MNSANGNANQPAICALINQRIFLLRVSIKIITSIVRHFGQFDLFSLLVGNSSKLATSAEDICNSHVCSSVVKSQVLNSSLLAFEIQF